MMSNNATRSETSKTEFDTDRLDMAGTNEMKSRKLEYIAIDQIKPNPYYVRKANRALRRKLKASYRRFGENAPLLLDKNLAMLAGTQRLEALRELGNTHAWVMVLDHLSDAQARAYAIADNKISEYSDWDEKMLAIELKSLDAISIDFELTDTGFDRAAIDFLFQSLDNGDFDGHDEFVQPTGPAVSELNELWTLDSHRLLCANSLMPDSYTQLMRGDIARAVFADAPYNLRINGHVTGNGRRKHHEFPEGSGEKTPAEFTDFLTDAFRQIGLHSLPGALIYACMDFRHLREILGAIDRVNFPLLNLCVWAKSNAGMGSLYRSQHELVFVLKNGTAPHINNIELGKHGRNRSNVWNYAGANSFPRRGQEDPLNFHPTVKPVGLVADAILDCSDRSDIILDPFIGSGTTILAAERTGRRCYGIELDPVHVDCAVRRWERMSGQHAVNALGQTFAEVSRLRRNDR
jgi:DNA modification methylase